MIPRFLEVACGGTVARHSDAPVETAMMAAPCVAALNDHKRRDQCCEWKIAVDQKASDAGNDHQREERQGDVASVPAPGLAPQDPRWMMPIERIPTPAL